MIVMMTMRIALLLMVLVVMLLVVCVTYTGATNATSTTKRVCWKNVIVSSEHHRIVTVTGRLVVGHLVVGRKSQSMVKQECLLVHVVVRRV